jgi:predicted RNase H-like HicB family nuclease
MEIQGKIRKSKGFWLIEVPSLDMMTQGKSKEEALEMIKDAIEQYIDYYFDIKKGLEVKINRYKKNIIGVATTDNAILLSLSLRRQREMSGSTVREAAERLGSKSPNAYAQYENGKKQVSLDQYEKLLYAANPSQHTHLRVI